MKTIKTILILTVLPILISACGETEIEKPVPIVAPEPKPEPVNFSPPVINNIVVPDQVHALQRRITLEAVAEDPDGNTLTYNWEAPGKLIYTKTMSIAFWTAPIDLGTATINLTVNDGIHEVHKSVDVTVTPALIVPGQEAAGVRLGDTLDKVIHLYGEPNSKINVNEWDGVHHDIQWETRYDWYTAALTLYFRNNRVYEIEIGAPNTATTENGIGIGTDFDQANIKLGPYNAGGGGDNVGQEPAHEYRWEHLGIEIERVGSIVKWIVIFEKEDWGDGNMDHLDHLKWWE